MARMLPDEPSLFESEDEDETEEKKTPEDKNQQIRRELKNMLYGFGDVKEPMEETIEELYEVVMEFINAVCYKAASLNGHKKVTLDEIHFLIRRDMKKFTRVAELLSMSEELKKARKDFENEIPL
uniref:Transcription initiation factor TFIID subunit 13 n=1 Tax=Panagrolaimus superbus TaxID=310955 RepID=A0A914Y6G2_9BILA